MTEVDALSVVRRWVSDWNARWRSLSIKMELKLSEEPRLNKALTTLETPTHVASVTAWGTGTIEFIVLDLATQTEVIMRDKEYRTAEELRALLDECADSFDEIVRPRQ